MRTSWISLWMWTRIPHSHTVSGESETPTPHFTPPSHHPQPFTIHISHHLPLYHPPHTHYLHTINHTHREFSSSEMLAMESKYYCEECCSKQEATKRLRVKKLPHILALHLKRFKFMEQTQRFTKLSYRVAFPWELKLFNTVSHTRLVDLNLG